MDPDVWEREITKRDFSAQERRDLAAKGQAMPDGSYPTPTLASLNDAIQAWGRVGANSKASLKRYLMKRAKALKASQDVIDRISNLSLTKIAPMSLRTWIEKNKPPETVAEFVKTYGKVDRRTLRRVTKRDGKTGRILKSEIR